MEGRRTNLSPHVFLPRCTSAPRTARAGSSSPRCCSPGCGPRISSELSVQISNFRFPKRNLFRLCLLLLLRRQRETLKGGGKKKSLREPSVSDTDEQKTRLNERRRAMRNAASKRPFKTHKTLRYVDTLNTLKCEHVVPVLVFVRPGDYARRRRHHTSRRNPVS